MAGAQDDGPPLRPLGVGELLDAAIKLVRRHFVALALLTLIVAVVIELISGLITATTTDFCHGPRCSREFGRDVVYVWKDDATYYGGRLVIVLLAVVQAVVVQVACFRILAEGYLGRSVGARASMHYAFGRARSTLWLSVVLAVGLTLAFVCLLIPVIWLGIAWSVAIPVLLVEDLRGTKALRRSFELVKGHWWQTFFKLVVSYLMIGVATAGASAVLVALLLFAVNESSYAGLALNGVINVVVQVVTTPFLAAVATLIYFDLRVRKEGFDLAILAERMGGGAATEPAAAAGGTDAFGRPATSPRPVWTPGRAASGSDLVAPSEGSGAGSAGSWGEPAPGASSGRAPADGASGGQPTGASPGGAAGPAPSPWARPAPAGEPPGAAPPGEPPGAPPPDDEPPVARPPEGESPPPEHGGWAPPEPGRPREP